MESDTAWTEGERAILTLLDVSSLPLRDTDVADLTGIDVESVRACADRSSMLETAPGGMLVVTGPISDDARLASSRAVRQAIASDIVGHLHRRGVPAERLSSTAHELIGSDPELAARVLADAAAALWTSDPETAADYRLIVDRLAGGSGAERPPPWDLVSLLWRLGRVAESRALASRIFREHGDPDAEATALWWLARLAGAAKTASLYTTDALALAGTSDATRMRVRSLHLRLRAELDLGEEVDAQLPSAAEHARRLGDLESLVRLGTCQSIRHFDVGRYSSAQEFAERAAVDWSRSGEPVDALLTEAIWGLHIESVLGDPIRALKRVDRMQESLADTPRSAAHGLLRAERSLAFLTLARVDDAWDEAGLAIADIEGVWSVPVAARDRLTSLALHVRLKVALLRGDASNVHELRTRFADGGTSRGAADARIAWWRLCIDATEGGTTTGRPSTALPLAVALDPPDEIFIARILLAAGRPEAFERWAASASERASLDHNPLARVIADHLEGLTRARPRQLEQVVADWTELGRPLMAAIALADAGRVAVEQQEPGGIELVQRAEKELMSIGASREAWILRGILREHGMPTGRERNTLDEAGLTGMERRVVERAVLGLTTRRIAEELAISPHTVTTHIRHIYTKLGVSSRKELRQNFRALGDIDSG